MVSPDDARFVYAAHVSKVYDGDTITVDLDLGLGITVHGQKLRLYGINTPEVRGEERPRGLVVRDIVRALILDKWVIVRTHRDKTGKYGRWLGTIYVPDAEGWLNVNQMLVEDGLAELNSYGDSFDGWPELSLG